MPDPRRDEDTSLRQLADEQAALSRLAILVARGVSPDELFSAVSGEVGRLFGSGQAAIGRYEPDGSSVVYVGISQGLSTMPVGTRWPLEDFLASTAVYRTGLPARQEQSDYEKASGQVADTLRALNTVSRVGAPIFVGGSLWGVLLVTDTCEPLPPDTEERLAKFTKLVATAIANAESRAELAASEARAQGLAREQAALRRVAILVAEGTTAAELFSAVADEVGRLFDAEAAVARFEADGSGMIVVGLTSGIPVVSIGTRWPLEDFLASTAVFRTGRPARSDHTGHHQASGHVADSLRQMNYVSTAAAPITVEGSLWGVMTVSDPRKPLPADTEQRVTKFTELVGTAIANAESRADLASSEARAYGLAREQAALRRVATLVAEGSSADELFAAVAREVADVMTIPVVGLCRFEAEDNFTMVGIAGKTSFSVGSLWPVTRDGLAGMILATGRPARKDDYTTMAGPLGTAVRDDRMTGTVGVPIVVEGTAWGFIVGAARPGNPIPDGTEERLARFTELVATAIANSQAREQLARLAEEQAALRRVATLVAQDAPASQLFDAVAGEVGTLFGADFAAMIRYESDRSFVTTIAFWAAAGEHPSTPRYQRTFPGDPPSMLSGSRKPTRVDDWTDVPGPVAQFVHGQLGVKLSVGCPIMVEGSLWGGLAVHSKGDPFPPDTEARLLNFTELVATSIANTHARAQVSRMADEQAALRRVATLVARGASPSEVFNLVNREVGQLFGSDRNAIARFEPDGSGMVVVAVSRGLPGVSIGTRWPLEDYLASSAVYRTGRPARTDLTGHFDASGPVADSLRAGGSLSTVATPIVVEGELWGVLAMSDDGESIPPDTEERLEKFTELVATAIANAESRAELGASRARVIAAGDDARRRIERDLHDGAQQRLVTLSVALRTMQATMPAGTDGQRLEVARIADGLNAAVQELRELSRGIHPAVLTQGGLAPALKALRRRSPVRVALDICFEHRLPDQVEAAAYYTVSEALTNASKYASATRVYVAVRVTHGTLHLSIRDDGVGGADPSKGSGLTGLRDRVEALEGRIRINSQAGNGTSIEVEIPLPQTVEPRSGHNEPPEDQRTGVRSTAAGSRTPTRPPVTRSSG